MALGTTNISIANIFSEVDKSTVNNMSLSDLRFAANDFGISQWTDTSSANNSGINGWKGYAHHSLRFRYSPPFAYETYRDNSSTLLGAGITKTDVGTTGGDFSGTLSFDGTNDYSYFQGLNSGVAYKQNPSGYMTLVFWVKPQFPAAQTTMIHTDLTAYNNISPYKGFNINLRDDGKLRPLRGDGDGTASSDRRTFETTWTLDENEWNMVALMLSNSSNTASSSANYAYKKAAAGNAEGLNFLSGTGGALSFDSGSGATDAFYLSSAVNGRYFTGQLGHIWVFAERLTSSDITEIYNATSGFYGL